MLKFFAAFAMLLDHIGFLFFDINSPLWLLFRGIGRLAMPLFAYKIAIGFKYSNHLSRYISRIFIMALFAQIPYTCMLYDIALAELFMMSNLYFLFGKLNIGFTFIIALLILKYYIELTTSPQRSSFLYFIYIFFLLLASFSCDYELYGVLVVIVFYICLEYKLNYYIQALLLFLTTALFYNPATLFSFTLANYLQFIAVFSILPLALLKDSRIKFMPKYFFYYFYPLHLYLLLLIKGGIT